MTPFAIFAFVLTFGYFIYFAVMITLDLHAKPADGQKNEEEDIDVEGMKDEGVEAPKVISESSDLEGGRVTYTDTTTDDGLRVISPTGTIVQSYIQGKYLGNRYLPLVFCACSARSKCRIRWQKRGKCFPKKWACFPNKQCLFSKGIECFFFYKIRTRFG